MIKSYFIEVIENGKAVYYLYNSTHRRGTTINYCDCYKSIKEKTGKSKDDYNEYSVFLDTPKNRDDWCIDENTTIIDCR